MCVSPSNELIIPHLLTAHLHSSIKTKLDSQQRLNSHVMNHMHDNEGRGHDLMHALWWCVHTRETKRRETNLKKTNIPKIYICATSFTWSGFFGPYISECVLVCECMFGQDKCSVQMSLPTIEAATYPSNNECMWKPAYKPVICILFFLFIQYYKHYKLSNLHIPRLTLYHVAFAKEINSFKQS